jgi:hypothetical protein
LVVQGKLEQHGPYKPVGDIGSVVFPYPFYEPGYRSILNLHSPIIDLKITLDKGGFSKLQF